MSEIPIFPLESIQFLSIPLKFITVNFSQEWAMVGNVGFSLAAYNHGFLELRSVTSNGKGSATHMEIHGNVFQNFHLM